METIGEYKVFENQSWLDISMILFGSPDLAYELAEINNSNLTNEILAGSIIKYHKNMPNNKLILLSLSSNNSIPATGLSSQQLINDKPKGIDYWAIQTDFIVS